MNSPRRNAIDRRDSILNRSHQQRTQKCMAMTHSSLDCLCCFIFFERLSWNQNSSETPATFWLMAPVSRHHASAPFIPFRKAPLSDSLGNGGMWILRVRTRQNAARISRRARPLSLSWHTLRLTRASKHNRPRTKRARQAFFIINSEASISELCADRDVIARTFVSCIAAILNVPLKHFVFDETAALHQPNGCFCTFYPAGDHDVIE